MTDAAPRDDGVYFDTLERMSLARWLARRARRRIFEDFMELMRPHPGDAILDIGVSDVITEEANFLERQYPHRADITCAGLGDGASVQAAYPGVAFRRLEPNALLPFPDKHFAIATCNAVLEHVGGMRERRALAAEMLRVAHRVLIAIPNRWFPVEHHTATPLLHFWPAAFRTYCAATGKSYWAAPAHLEFLSPASLAAAFPDGTAPIVRYSGLRLGPFSSNLVAAAGIPR